MGFAERAADGESHPFDTDDLLGRRTDRAQGQLASLGETAGRDQDPSPIEDGCIRIGDQPRVGADRVGWQSATGPALPLAGRQLGRRQPDPPSVAIHDARDSERDRWHGDEGGRIVNADEIEHDHCRQPSDPGDDEPGDRRSGESDRSEGRRSSARIQAPERVHLLAVFVRHPGRAALVVERREPLACLR